MGEYAPSAIRSLYNEIEKRIPRAQLSGILGDKAHTYGYHRCRAVLPASDYSVKLSLDQAGDPLAASALDVTLPADLMKTVTARLLAAAKAGDPRLRVLREFCGTTTGTVTHGYDLAYKREFVDEWDDSHLWHVHLSFYRNFANDLNAIKPIADVMAGIKEDDVPLTEAEMNHIADLTASKVWARAFKSPTSGVSYTAASYVINGAVNADAGKRAAEAALKQIGSVASGVADLLPRVAEVQAAVKNGAGVAVAGAQSIADAVVAKLKALAWGVR